MRSICGGLLMLALAAGTAVHLAADEKGAPQEEKIVYTNQLNLIVRMQGPYDADVPLQVVCYFKHKPAGDVTKGAPVELDKRLGGAITALRNRGEFVGDELETLLLETRGKIPARQLLLIGLGEDESLSLEKLERVGRVAYREAAKLGATSAAFAPLIRDQGNDRLPAGDVETSLIRGLLLARDTDQRMQKESLAKKYALTTWVVEAGPAFYKDTIAGVHEGIKTADAIIKERSRESYSTVKLGDCCTTVLRLGGGRDPCVVRFGSSDESFRDHRYNWLAPSLPAPLPRGERGDLGEGGC